MPSPHHKLCSMNVPWSLWGIHSLTPEVYHNFKLPEFYIFGGNKNKRELKISTLWANHYLPCSSIFQTIKTIRTSGVFYTLFVYMISGILSFIYLFFQYMINNPRAVMSTWDKVLCYTFHNYFIMHSHNAFSISNTLCTVLITCSWCVHSSFVLK